MKWRERLAAARTQLVASQAQQARLAEAGRMLSAANETKIRDALTALQTVLDALDSASTTEGALAVGAGVPLLEGYSSAASRAASGTSIMTSLLWLISDESEGDQDPEDLADIATLQQAFGLVNAYVLATIAEIGTPEDAGDSMADQYGGFMDAVRSRLKGWTLRGLREHRAQPKPPSRPSSEAIEVAELVPLQEATAINAKGEGRVKIIQPGWGTSGYYSAAVLERDGPVAFKKGTQMYWDHPTLTEDRERPERSLRDLAAVLTADATFDAAGPAGPGLYAPIKAFEGYQQPINALAEYMGTSIRAQGQAEKGSAEGRDGKLVTAITSAKSVDFVTQPGAGGAVLSLFEAAKGRNTAPPQEGNDMDLQEATRLLEAANKEKAEAEQRAARAETALLVERATGIASRQLATVRALPAVVAAKLAPQLGGNPPLKDGQLDEVAFKETIDKAVAEEIKYLTDATGRGQVRGFGDPPAPPPGAPANGDLTEAFASLGLSENGAKLAAAGRG